MHRGSCFPGNCMILEIRVFKHPAKSNCSEHVVQVQSCCTVRRRSCLRVAGAKESAHLHANVTQQHLCCCPLRRLKSPKERTCDHLFKEILQSNSPHRSRPCKIQPRKQTPQRERSSATTKADSNTCFARLQLQSS